MPQNLLLCATSGFAYMYHSNVLQNLHTISSNLLFKSFSIPGPYLHHVNHTKALVDIIANGGISDVPFLTHRTSPTMSRANAIAAPIFLVDGTSNSTPQTKSMIPLTSFVASGDTEMKDLAESAFFSLTMYFS